MGNTDSVVEFRRYFKFDDLALMRELFKEDFPDTVSFSSQENYLRVGPISGVLISGNQSQNGFERMIQPESRKFFLVISNGKVALYIGQGHYENNSFRAEVIHFLVQRRLFAVFLPDTDDFEDSTIREDFKMASTLFDQLAPENNSRT